MPSSSAMKIARMEELLTIQLRDLKAQVLRAQHAQRQLFLKQAVVSAICGVLQAVQHELDPSQGDIEPFDPDLLLTSADEALLKPDSEQQPCVSSYSCNLPHSDRPSAPSTPLQYSCGMSCSYTAGARMQPAQWLDDWPEDTLSRPDDPLRHFRELMEEGPLPYAAALTLPALQEQYLGTIKEGLVHLVMLENPHTQPWQAERSLAAIRQLVHAHLHKWTSLVACGKSDLLFQFHLSNCLTGVREEQQDLRPYQVAAHKLGLTQQQKQCIADCMPVFKQMQQAVLDELQEVQQQPVEEPDSDADSDSCRTQLPIGMTHQLSGRQLSQQRNRQRTQRLHVLLRKQHLIGVCCNAYVLGCMTHLQILKLAQLVFPLPPFVYLFGAEIERVMQQEQAASDFA